MFLLSASLRESRILSSMSTTTISTQRQQSTQKLCSSLHDSSDLICCVPMLLMSITISLNVPTPGGHAL